MIVSISKPRNTYFPCALFDHANALRMCGWHESDAQDDQIKSDVLVQC